MTDIIVIDQVDDLSLRTQVEYYRIKLSDVLTERDTLQATVKELRAKLEEERQNKKLAVMVKELKQKLQEERQQNASLRSGDDYERGTQ